MSVAGLPTSLIFTRPKETFEGSRNTSKYIPAPGVPGVMLIFSLRYADTPLGSFTLNVVSNCTSRTNTRIIAVAALLGAVNKALEPTAGSTLPPEVIHHGCSGNVISKIGQKEKPTYSPTPTVVRSLSGLVNAVQ